MRKLNILFLVILFTLINCVSQPKIKAELSELQQDSMINATIVGFNKTNDTIGGMGVKIPGGIPSFNIKLQNISENNIQIIWENSTIVDESGVHRIFVFKSNKNDTLFNFQNLILPKDTFSLFELTSFDNVNIQVSSEGMGTTVGGISVGSTVSSNTFNKIGVLLGNSFNIGICYKIDGYDEKYFYNFIINIIE